MIPPTLPYLLTAYGLPHVMGYLPTLSGEPHPSPLTPVQLMDAAVELGLAGVEMPLPKRSVLPLDTFSSALEERGLRLVVDYAALLETDAQPFRETLRSAAACGATVVRAILSRLLCGDRRGLEGGWEAHLQAAAARLREVLPLAGDLGVCIAVENHQDATTGDLLRLADMVGHHPAYGICLDAGNPLAVGEGPVEAAEELAPLIRHVHLKDYTIHFAPEGYRLARCPAGDGVVDFPSILEIIRTNGHKVLPGIEIAAQPTRTIPLLEDDWWACYPVTPTRNLVPALRILWQHGRPVDEPYSSAWERGADSATVSAEEWDVLRRSVEYFRSLEL